MGDRVVVHILPSFDTGGLGSLGLEMIEAWPEKEVRHVVIAPKYERTKPDLFPVYREAVGDLNVTQITRSPMDPAPKIIEMLHFGISRMMRGASIANVISYNFVDHGYNAQAVRRCGFQGEVAAHVGTVLPDQETPRVIARAKLNNRFIPASTAVANSLKQLADENTKIHPIVWNGVNLEKFSRRRPQSAPVTPRRFTFGFSGRMAKPAVKDWEILIKSFKEAAIPNSQLAIAGDGELRSELVAMAENAPIYFAGNIAPENMPVFLSLIDVFVMAALPFEGFSMALVEAIAAGCMVIGTDVPSVLEVFDAVAESPREAGDFLTHDVEGMVTLMRAIAAQEAVRHYNWSLMQRLREKLDARRMANAYWLVK